MRALFVRPLLWIAMVLLASGVGSLAIAADQWPQWRGPHADGSSATANPPTEWSEDKHIQWKVAVPGKGSGTPIVWNDRVYVLTAIPTQRKPPAAAKAPPKEEPAEDRGQRGGRGGMVGPAPTNFFQFALLGYDRQSGEEVLRAVATESVPHEAGHSTNTFASASPVTDGKHIYAYFGSNGVFCFDMKGNLVWQRDLGQMETRNQFGEGSSPALHGDTLVVPWDHEGQSMLFALRASDGEIRWQKERDERTTWATPLIVEHAGRTQVVTNGHIVRSYDLETGELLWQCGGQVQNPIPSPVRLGDVVYCMTGYQGNAVYALPLSAMGDITGSDAIVWSRDDAAPYVASPTLYQGQLYYTKSRDGIVTSVDAKTGEVLIKQQRLPGIESVYASPVAAAGRVYFVGRNGTTTVLRHGTTLEVLATNPLDEGVDASPVIVGDQLFLRGAAHLYCISEKPAR